jgi:tRNA pseudouridine38-40 synthase
MTVAYDGHPFHGFAPQPGLRTVGSELGAVLERVLRHPVSLTCAGRTDAGVHAWGQVVSFDALAEGLDPRRLQASVNQQSGPTVVVREAEVTSGSFDARRSAGARRYRYTVLNRPEPDPFLAATSWHVPWSLDRDVLGLSCDPVIGEHDFASFCRRVKDGPSSTVRRVHSARWRDLEEGVLRFEIEAAAFCHQMVRSLVSTMVDMGRGRGRAGGMAALLRAADRSLAGQVAPAHGLCLWEVVYPAAAGPAGDGPGGRPLK